MPLLRTSHCSVLSSEQRTPSTVSGFSAESGGATEDYGGLNRARLNPAGLLVFRHRDPLERVREAQDLQGLVSGLLPLVLAHVPGHEDHRHSTPVWPSRGKRNFREALRRRSCRVVRDYSAALEGHQYCRPAHTQRFFPVSVDEIRTVS